MSEPIVYIDRSEVVQGKLEALKRAMNELVEFIEAREPQLIAYEAYFNDDATQVSVVHIHRDSASLELHMRVAGPEFPKFAEFVRLRSIDIYGRPNDDLLDQIRDKARLLGNGTVAVHGNHAGFARLDVGGAPAGG